MWEILPISWPSSCGDVYCAIRPTNVFAPCVAGVRNGINCSNFSLIEFKFDRIWVWDGHHSQERGQEWSRGQERPEVSPTSGTRREVQGQGNGVRNGTRSQERGHESETESGTGPRVRNGVRNGAWSQKRNQNFDRICGQSQERSQERGLESERSRDHISDVSNTSRTFRSPRRRPVN